MKFRSTALAAILICCISCVEVDNRVGSGFLPREQSYITDTINIYLDEIYLSMADSLSGFSQRQMVVGSIMDEEGNVSGRDAVLTLAPLQSEMDFGKNPKLKKFHLALELDSASVYRKSNENILQTLNVYELSEPINARKNFDCNAKIKHGSKQICLSRPVLDGDDSLCINFTEEYAKKFFSLSSDDLETWDSYTAKIPGIYLRTDPADNCGGRFNEYEIQMSYSTTLTALAGNYAKLSFTSDYDGVQKDTAFYFYVGAQKKMDPDSLLANTTSGTNYPQFSLNLTDEEAFRPESGKKATNAIPIYGGGGPKPRIRGGYLRDIVKDAISRKGYDPSKVLINKARMNFFFEFPGNLDEMFLYPDVLSPTTRIKTDTTMSYVGITDNSSESENMGDIDRVYKCYSPDFSYHMQQILSCSDDDLSSGDYDLWMLLMSYVTTTTDTSNSSMSDYYQQLAYQSYYGSMYGGGGIGGYDSYSNYYNYMMLAQYYGTSTSTSTALQMDNSNYYKCSLYGPLSSVKGTRPRLTITYSVPKYK